MINEIACRCCKKRIPIKEVFVCHMCGGVICHECVYDTQQDLTGDFEKNTCIACFHHPEEEDEDN